jgi:hypothetical protein
MIDAAKHREVRADGTDEEPRDLVERGSIVAVWLEDGEDARLEAAHEAQEASLESEVTFERGPALGMHRTGVVGGKPPRTEPFHEERVDAAHVRHTENECPARTDEPCVRGENRLEFVEVLDQTQGIHDIETSDIEAGVEDVALEDVDGNPEQLEVPSCDVATMG